MPHSIRRVQNRVKKETNEVKLSELRAVKAENQKLKRELARLRREREKFSTEVIEEEVESLGDIENQKTGIIPVLNVPQCPKCNSVNLTIIPMGVKNITACRDCIWRKAS